MKATYLKERYTCRVFGLPQANFEHTCNRLSRQRLTNRPRSIYQYSSMAPRLSGQNSIFGGAFFVSKSLLGTERQKKLENFAILTRKPRGHAGILIYRTWPIEENYENKLPRSIF